MKLYTKIIDNVKYFYNKSNKLVAEKPVPSTMTRNWYSYSNAGNFPAGDIIEISFQNQYSGKYNAYWLIDSGENNNPGGRIVCYRNDNKLIISNENPYFDYIFAPQNASNLFLGTADAADTDNYKTHFANLEKISNIDMLRFDYTISMRGMFYNCQKLTTVGKLNAATNNVTDMSWMFTNCTKLKDIDLQNLNVSNVTTMGSMFQMGAGSSTKGYGPVNIDTRYWRPIKCQNFNAMFWGCRNLKSLALPYWESYKTYNINDQVAWETNNKIIIYECIKSSINLQPNKYPEYWKIIDDSPAAVNKCNGLKNWKAASYRSNSFKSTTLDMIKYLNLLKYQDKDIFGANSSVRFIDKTLKYFTKDNLGKYSLVPEKDLPLDNPTTTTLENLYIVNPAIMYYTRQSATKLIRDYNPDASSDNQYYISNIYEPTFCSADHLISHCNSLIRQTFDTWDFSNFTNIDCMLNETSGFKDIIDTDDSILEAAYKCDNWDVSHVLTFGQLFETYNTHAKKISGLTTWNTSSCIDFGEMFRTIYNVEELDLSSFNTRNNLYTQILENGSADSWLRAHPRNRGYETGGGFYTDMLGFMRGTAIYVKVKDTSVIKNKYYYTRENDNYILIKNPVNENISTYYEKIRGYSGNDNNAMRLMHIKLGPDFDTEGSQGIPSDNRRAFSLSKPTSYWCNQPVSGQWFWKNHPDSLSDEEATYTTENVYFTASQLPNPVKVNQMVELVAVGSIYDDRTVS